MDIKAVIKTFDKSQNDLNEKINLLKSLYQNEEGLWKQLEALNSNMLINERVMNFLADSMQVVNNEKRLELFDLLDIKYIYQLLVQYYPDNLQYHIDLISFIYNVLDDEKEALKLINEAIKLIDKKRICLKGFLEKIKTNNI